MSADAILSNDVPSQGACLWMCRVPGARPSYHRIFAAHSQCFLFDPDLYCPDSDSAAGIAQNLLSGASTLPLLLRNKSVDSAQLCFLSEGNNGASSAARRLEGNNMQSFMPGLFDHVNADDDGPQGQFHARPKKADKWHDSITRNLEARLSTRSDLRPHALGGHLEASGSIANYGPIDFAGARMTGDTNQQRIRTAVRLAIVRHEPRLHRVTGTLQRNSVQRARSAL
jgi:predicted component of type VI protein secretion system